MTDIEFSFKIDAEPQGSYSYRDNTSQLGDGYSVSSADGINTEMQTWPVSVTSAVIDCGSKQSKAMLAFAFLRARKSAAESFMWRNPHGELIRVQAGKISTKKSGNAFSVSTTFTQVYR